MSAPTTPARKRAPRKTAPRKAAPAATTGFEPIRIGSSAEPVEMVTLFTIDDREYRIPASPSPQAGLRFLREARDPQIGTVTALSNLVVEVLGADNLKALEESPKTTREDLRAVFKAVRRHVLGPAGDDALSKLLAGAADPS